METLAYKPNAAETFKRLRGLYERRAQDQILARMAGPSPALAEFQSQYPEGYCDYPDPAQRIRFWDRYLRERIAIDDDSLPSAYLSEMDQGLYGGVLGGKTQFLAHPENGWISSMVAPLLNDWNEFDAIRFDRSRPWLERYHRQLRTFVEGANGKFAISHLILIDGLNFVFELLGATNTYLSLAEQPDMVRRAIDFAFQLNLDLQNVFFDLVPLVAGGTASNLAQWLPGRIVSESVDPFHLTSVEYFETWGREPVERIFGRFDGGVIHLHGNGRRLLEAVAKLDGLKAISLGDAPGYPRALEVLETLQARTGDTPLIVQADYASFNQKLDQHQLCTGVFYNVQGVPDVTEANRLMEKVRRYRA